MRLFHLPSSIRHPRFSLSLASVLCLLASVFAPSARAYEFQNSAIFDNDSAFSSGPAWFRAGPAWLMNSLPGSHFRARPLYVLEDSGNTQQSTSDGAYAGTLHDVFNVNLFNNVSGFVGGGGATKTVPASIPSAPQTAGPLVTFTTSGITTAVATFPATQQDPGVGNTPTLSRVGLTATARTGSFTSSNNLITQNTPDFSQKYVTFSVAPSANTVLIADSISFSVSGSNTAPNQYGVAYSTDGFSTFNQSTGAVTGTDTAQSFNFTNLITNDTLEFRFQNFGTTGVASPVASTGTFRLGSTGTPIQVQGSTASTSADTIALTAATEIRNSGALNLSTTISGAFGVTKTGAGVLTLAGANTYTGGTAVNAGTLLVNNTTGSGTGTGTVTVNNAGTTLGGTGTIAGATTVNNLAKITAATDGTIGTLTLSNNLTFSGASTYVVDINSTTSDLLAIGGQLNLLGLNDVIDFNAVGTPTAASYTLATYTGVLGTFDVVGDLPAGYTLVYLPTELDLVAIPEPSTWIGAALALGAIGFTQRRRFRGLIARHA